METLAQICTKLEIELNDGGKILAKGENYSITDKELFAYAVELIGAEKACSFCGWLGCDLSFMQ